MAGSRRTRATGGDEMTVRFTDAYTASMCRAMAADRAEVGGRDPSQAVADALMDAWMPKGRFARDQAGRVYGQGCSIVRSLSETFRYNEAGEGAGVRNPSYKGLLELAHDLASRSASKLPGEGLDMGAIAADAEEMADAVAEGDEALADWASRYAASLASGPVEIDALEAIGFALKAYPHASGTRAACGFMAAILDGLAASQEADPRRAPETARDRIEYLARLDALTKGWKREAGRR